MPRGADATITGFHREARAVTGAFDPGELECRLLELGLVEGATIRVEHRVGVRGDPIAIRINGHRLIALRRREALFVAVERSGSPSE